MLAALVEDLNLSRRFDAADPFLRRLEAIELNDGRDDERLLRTQRERIRNLVGRRLDEAQALALKRLDTVKLRQNGVGLADANLLVGNVFFEKENWGEAQKYFIAGSIAACRIADEELREAVPK